MLSELNQQAFDAMEKPAAMLVEFYSKTCGPCKMLGFVLKDVARTMPDFPIYQIDFDENRELKERLGVKGFPTLLFFKGETEVSRLEGLKQKPVVLKAIEELLA